MTPVEVHAGGRWLPLGRGDDCPAVPESSTLRIRGFDGSESVRLGPVPLAVDAHGVAELRLNASEDLRGHLGLIEVQRQSGASAGEFEVVPDKMSETAFGELRSALEAAWAGLVFDADSVSRLRGVLPSPAALWHAVEAPVREIIAEPRTVVASTEGTRRMESVRRPSELTMGVVRGAHLQRPGRSRVLIRDANTPENALVAETLRRLAVYARRQRHGAEVATRASRALREQPFASCSPLHGSVQPARLRMRHDARYRRVDRVLRVLDRPEAHATEGPGEARLGVKSIIRLYEYWVYLKVLEACRERYGDPIEPGFRALATRSRTGTVRLGMPAGTTVSFPGDVHAGFEPRITSSARHWQGLENVPHPDPRVAQLTITPDVVVLRKGAEPAAVVVDAKYVGRIFVEFEAAKLHARYSRIRANGMPVVRNVVAAHPHVGIDALWAGYGSVPMVPGEPVEILHLLP